MKIIQNVNDVMKKTYTVTCGSLKCFGKTIFSFVWGEHSRRIVDTDSNTVTLLVVCPVCNATNAVEE